MSNFNLDNLLLKKKDICFFLSGIGGIGISGIAEILNHLGFKVIGSDLNQNNNTKRLAAKGVKCFFGQNRENITNNKIDFLIRSSAIKDDNPEIIAANSQNIQILSRANILSAILKMKKSIIISGTHGKTTTTSLIGHIACQSPIKSSIISGGIMNNYASNVVLGSGDWIVAEADESDGSFMELSSLISVITNIETEHMDYFKTETNLKNAFLQYMNNVPASGNNIICYDDPVCKELIKKSSQNNIISYGFDKNSDVYAYDIIYNSNVTSFKLASNTEKFKSDTNLIFELPLIGHFNVLNAIAAIISCVAIGIDIADVKRYLKSFKGVGRRLTYVGKANDIEIYDDYAHHPTEINATLTAVQLNKKTQDKKIIAVFQPHRYSRLKDHYQNFIEALNIADKILVTDIFAAGEDPIAGISKEKFCDDLNILSAQKCFAVNNINDLAQYVKNNSDNGDTIICLGAGDITKYANLLPKQLAKIL